MNSARWRMPGAGELENEWNRLFGFRRARVSTEEPEAVEAAARWASEGVEMGVEDGPDGLETALPCSGKVVPGERPLRWEPKLRTQDGETVHLGREWGKCERRMW